MTENTQEEFGSITSGSFSNSEYCPEDFIIPLQSDFQEAIDKLGTNAYSVFTRAKYGRGKILFDKCKRSLRRNF